jgi:glycosyltransferase involved in cell wall biosynthesis
MRVLLVHNYYQQPGGEDAVFAAESLLLRRHGHEVVEYTEDNRDVKHVARGILAARAIWSGSTQRRLTEILRRSRFDIAHFHNTFPLISPSAYAACREADVPVAQTLHNYRLLCPAATFFRAERVCEECLDKTLPWPAVLHGCYRDSRAQSASAASVLAIHRWLKTWQEQVNVYIALTEFAKRKFVEGGLPSEKIHVKPNFVHPDPGRGNGTAEWALFVGRLSPEKGIWTVLRAWHELREIPLKLKIIGDGPLMNEIRVFVTKHKLDSVEILGHRVQEDLKDIMKAAKFLIVPSLCYETFGLVAVEAFACGVPVIASRLGAIAELVEEGYTGLLFRAGDSADLADKVRLAVDQSDAIYRMRKNARDGYEKKYAAERNYSMLMEIYKHAITSCDRSSVPTPH